MVIAPSPRDAGYPVAIESQLATVVGNRECVHFTVPICQEQLQTFRMHAYISTTAMLQKALHLLPAAVVVSISRRSGGGASRAGIRQDVEQHNRVHSICRGGTVPQLKQILSRGCTTPAGWVPIEPGNAEGQGVTTGWAKLFTQAASANCWGVAA